MSKTGGFYVEVLDDVLAAIQNGDWRRGESVTKGERFYIFGWRCMEMFDWFDHDLPSEGDVNQSLVADWLKKARSASAIPDYKTRILAEYDTFGPGLRQAADRFVDWWERGVPESADQFIDEASGFSTPLVWAEVNGRCRVGLFRELGQALRVEQLRRTGEEPPEGEDVSRQGQLLFLGEALTKVGKAVERSGDLEPLPFADPLLEEATRCYLYQFHRATVLLCASAIEAHLKQRAGNPTRKEVKDSGLDYYQYLVERASLSAGQREDARRVFDVRNRVAHRGEDPGLQAAQACLAAARVLLQSLSGSPA